MKARITIIQRPEDENKSSIELSLAVLKDGTDDTWEQVKMAEIPVPFVRMMMDVTRAISRGWSHETSGVGAIVKQISVNLLKKLSSPGNEVRFMRMIMSPDNRKSSDDFREIRDAVIKEMSEEGPEFAEVLHLYGSQMHLSDVGDFVEGVFKGGDND